MQRAGITPYELVKRIKAHNFIRPLIEGGVTTEYGAALIPEGGYNAIPELVHPGLMLIGDSASLVNSVVGFSLAIWSGFFTAQAAVMSKRKHEERSVIIQYEQCIECGVCRLVYPHNNIHFQYPNGGHGVCFNDGVSLYPAPDNSLTCK